MIARTWRGWTRVEDTRAFSQAKFHAEDDRCLVERETTVAHYEVVQPPA